MRIFNTLSEEKEELLRPARGAIKLFVCGPTVYNYSHIGHARTYLAFDMIARYLLHQGFPLQYIQNITDIDDKIIDRAREAGSSYIDIANKFEKAFYEDMEAIHLQKNVQYKRASEHIEEIKDQISRLIEKSQAYQAEDGVYFEVRSFREYGKLSHQDINAMRRADRTAERDAKEDSLDFVLWKLRKEEDEPAWDSPWGKGRPAWHIEDTAISEKYFGLQYDLHGGALELKFPHHEAEIAIAESLTEKKPFVKIWMHTGWLLVNGEKMSKSLNNFITIRDFLKKYSHNVLRLMMLEHHYRSPIDYSDASAMQAENLWQSLLHTIGVLNFIVSGKYKEVAIERIVLEDMVGVAKQNFYSAMDDDFNTPKALAAIFGLINNLQRSKDNIFSLSKQDAKTSYNFIKESIELLGCIAEIPKIPKKVTERAAARELLRGNKQFIQADSLRKEINVLGYTIEDTPLGFFLWPNGKSR